MGKARLILGRILSFVLLFSVLPLPGTILAALFYRGGGLQATSWFSLSVMMLSGSTRMVLGQIARAALATLTVSTILGLASLLAWDSSERHSMLRAGRFVTLAWLVSAVLFPGVTAWIPILRQLPWLLSVAAMLAVVATAYAWPKARAGIREWIFAGVALTALFVSPAPSPKRFGEIARRQFSAQDIVLIGFDSVSASETMTVLDQFEPSLGQKVVFTNAQTTFPATSAAWRSMFSGKYPPPEVALPSLRWGSDRIGWLPADLRAAGYEPSIAQDLPEANWFGREESLKVAGLQGWTVSLQSFVWKSGFPLSTVGAAWWVGALGGPSSSFGRLAQCAECFVADSLKEIAKAAAKGPVFGAIHTCLAHGPYRLNLAEALRVPGWWRLPSTFFLGQQIADPRAREVRMDTLRRTLRNTLELLDKGGILGRATVFVLADHGSRDAGVPAAVTNNVMLAMFSPGDRVSTKVTVPVSLVDIAPTIRRIVGLADVATDGRVLPRTNAEGDPQRPVQTMTSGLRTVLTSFGIGNKSMSVTELGRLAQLHPDGTFDYSAQFIDRVRSLQLSQSSKRGEPTTGTAR